jgi:RNA polymerase sigma-70 factor, ECF subfamily
MDEETREELVRLLPRLRRFAFGLTGKIQDADDLVQTACERALARIHQWEPGTRLDSWMFRIIQNVFKDSMRKYKLRGDPVDPNDLAHLADNDAHRLPEIRSNLENVASAIQRLPEDQRLLLMLVCVEEHSYREAAAIIGIPVGTVMSRLARARLRLGQLLKDSKNNSKERSDHG